MAEETTKRGGCGCLPLVGLFFLGSFGLEIFEEVVGADLPDGLVTAAVVAAVVLLVVAGASAGRRRRRDHDVEDDGTPTPTRPVPRPPAPVEPSRPAPLPVPDVVLPPDEEETNLLRQRLAEAVAEISDKVDEFDPARPGLTSEEMIARAKRRIAERND